MSDPEVRRCGSCGTVAAVCDREWQHTSMGVATGSSTRDLAVGVLAISAFQVLAELRNPLIAEALDPPA